MPRTARKKQDNASYHVMTKSISEVDLFRDDADKEYYLMKLKQSIGEHHCEIYAYCLMSNHTHVYINSCGADISTFMSSLNTAYATYYNKRYNRHGPLFHGRYASTIVDTNAYSLTLTAYIHNNAKDLPGFKDKEETYRYSSYGIYAGIRKDREGLVNIGFILKQFGQDNEKACTNYCKFTESLRDTGILKEVSDEIMREYTENEYRSEKQYRVRNMVAEWLIKRVSEALGERIPEDLRSKYIRETSNFRAFVTYLMRVLCGYTYKKICGYIGNMSMSGISRLSKKGFLLLGQDSRYRDVFNMLLQGG